MAVFGKTDIVCREAIIAMLLYTNIDVNAQDNNLRNTPLHFASNYQYPTCAKLLIQAGASIGIKNKVADHHFDQLKVLTF